MSKFLKDVVAVSTWKPAQAIGHKELGHLSVGVPDGPSRARQPVVTGE
jgi:hypothetical protein